MLRKCEYPKKQKLEPCKFNKQLFLKKLFEIRYSLREIFFEKILLELDKFFNVIMKEFMFLGAATESALQKKTVLKNSQ